MTKLQAEIERFRSYLGDHAPSDATLAGVSEEIQLRALKARCRHSWAREGVPAHVLTELDAEALAAGDAVAVRDAQLKLAVATVQGLRDQLRDPDLAPEERDVLLALLLDFLTILKGEGVSLAPAIPPELRDIL